MRRPRTVLGRVVARLSLSRSSGLDLKFSHRRSQGKVTAGCGAKSV